MDFSDFEYHKDKVPSDYKEKERYFQHLEEKFVEEIMASPTAAGFFKNYHPNSIKSFVEFYAGRKANLAKSYSYYEGVGQRRVFKYRDKAEEVFLAIKQKKLFNLQLQWRAELITIKEINFSYDFVFWGEHIDDCSFLPEIYPEDIEVMKLYLQEEDAYNEISSTYDWQEYSDFMENEEGDYENLPKWYKFYDHHMGTASLMLLPDKRSAKETFYEDIGREEINRQREEEKKKNPSPPYIPPLPHLWTNSQKFAEFSKIYEKDKHFVNLFEIYREEEERDDKYEEENELLDEAIELLKDADVAVFMPGGLEWRHAIIRCAQIYEADIISKELDALFSEYCMFKELGISRGKTREELSEEYEEDSLISMIRRFILKGREVCGEPLNFDF